MFILRNVCIRESDLRKVAPAALLKKLFVIYNFPEFLQEIHRNRFQYKGFQCWGVVSQVFKWRRYVCGGLWFFVIIVTQVQLFRTFQRQVFCSHVDQKKIKEKKLLFCSIPLIYIRGTKTNTDKCLWIGPKWFESRL